MPRRKAKAAGGANARSMGVRLAVLPVVPLATPVIPTDMTAAGTTTS
jgi:hypothetical protein